MIVMKKLLFVSTLAVGLAASGCGSSNSATNMNRSNSMSTPTTNSNMNSNSNSGSNTTNMNSTASTKNDFWNEAAIGGMEEVELGRLASTKAVNPEVKKFGQLMVTDHSKANDELKAAAAKKNITVPSTLDATHQADVDRLKAMSGAEFDREYVEMMVDDHEKDVAKFKEQSEDSSDPDAKAFAAKTLPTLQKHLDLIKALQAKMK
jgi:putative membrane protein